MVSGPHSDAGPPDRYDTPYYPVTYGQSLEAPLPGTSNSFVLYDWDEDGLTDMLAKIKDGYGIVLHRNVGTATAPLFEPYRESQLLLREEGLGRFAILDVDGDGDPELASFGGGGLVVHTNVGTRAVPSWDRRPAVTPEGTPLEKPSDTWTSPRVYAADWDGDGRDDLIIGWERAEDIVPGQQPRKNERGGGWLDPSDVNPYVGEVLVSYNRSTAAGPVFTEPERLEAGGAPLSLFPVPKPAAHDVDGDGRLDLVVGDQEGGGRQLVFLRRADGGLASGVPLSDEDGDPIHSTLAIDGAFGDLTGDGRADLVAASLHSGLNRYTLYAAPAAPGLSGWADRGFLTMAAGPETPLYAMDISTVDPVDLDGDGDRDLLLGSEPSIPTIAWNVGSDAAPVYEPPVRLKFPDGRPWETYAIETGEGSRWGVAEWYADRITPRAADWDGDGTLDLVTGSMGRRLYFSKGVRVGGELRFERPQNFRFDGAELRAPDRVMPAVVDWDGDGHLDLVVGYDLDPDGASSTYPDPGQAFSGRVVVFHGRGGADPLRLGRPVTLRDGDGDPLLLRDYWDRVKGNRSAIDVADWNGDGRRDLVAFMFHRGVFWAEGRADGTFEDWEQLVNLYSHNTGVNVVDWNGDGTLDLLVGGDSRRMIEPCTPAHIAVFRGQDLDVPPGQDAPEGPVAAWERVENAGRGYWLQGAGDRPDVFTASQSATGDFTRWRQTPAGGGYVYLENRGSGQRLADVGGAPRGVAATDGGARAQWALVAVGDGSVRVENRQSGRWLQAAGGGNGTFLAPRTSTGPWTRWRFLAAGGAGATLAAESEAGGAPAAYALVGVYPNPSSAGATVVYTLPEAAEVQLAVYDALGRRVAVLAEGRRAAGRHEAVFDGGRLPAGPYVVRLAAGGQSLTQPLTLVR